MSFSIVYDWPARVALLDRMHWRTASDIDAAVIRFAAVDREARLVIVLRIYRA